jgi:hypothetical protein
MWVENNSEQAYCRQCGQALSDVRLALQGVASESLAKLKSSAQVMNGGIATLAVFNLIAVIITLISVVFGHPAPSTRPLPIKVIPAGGPNGGIERVEAVRLRMSSSALTGRLIGVYLSVNFSSQAY